MSDDGLGLTEEERQLEAGLQRLEPAAGLERDALLFAAGMRAQRHAVWTWRAAAGGLAALWLVTVGVMGWNVGEPSATSQVRTLTDGHTMAATMLAVERRAPRRTNAPSDGGLLAFMRVGDPMDRAIASDSTVLDLRQRVLIYGVGILPGDSGGDGKENVSGRKKTDEVGPTYGSALRNIQGERL